MVVVKWWWCDGGEMMVVEVELCGKGKTLE